MTTITEKFNAEYAASYVPTFNSVGNSDAGKQIAAAPVIHLICSYVWDKQEILDRTSVVFYTEITWILSDQIRLLNESLQHLSLESKMSFDKKIVELVRPRIQIETYMEDLKINQALMLDSQQKYNEKNYPEAESVNQLVSLAQQAFNSVAR